MWDKIKNRHKKTYSILFLLLFLQTPVIIFLLYGVFQLDLSYYHLKQNIAEAGMLSLCAFGFILFLPAIKLRRYFLLLFYIFLVFNVLIKVSYFYLHPYKISASTIFILIETNLSEVSEFIHAYLNEFNLILAFLLLFPLIWFKKVYSNFLLFSPNYYPIFILGLGLLISVTAIYNSKNLWNYNLYGVIWNSIEEYEEQTALYSKYNLDKTKGNFENVMVDNPRSSRKVFVLIIGESTTRHHMSLYDYPRQTNPLLNKIQYELSIFKDVISPHTHTIMSLSKIMTLNNYENNDQLEKGTIIQLMNQAGFKTYWISNQRPVGLHENLITKMARSSNKTFFLNTQNFNNKGQYDGVVLDPLSKVLNKKENLFIILHLLGTHADYSQRHPKEYEIFKDTDIAPMGIKDSKINRVKNDYDNAVLYNDYIVSQIINRVKMEDAVSYVLYLSDHGEDVYQVSNRASHTETMGTYPMYDVPFILWRSPAFKRGFSREFDLERKYMLDDFIYSIADLSGVKFKSFKSEKSIFSKDFIQRPRRIYNNKIYDSIVEK